MNETNTLKFQRTIGIDVGDRRSEICWLDGAGKVKQRRKVANGSRRGASGVRTPRAGEGGDGDG